MTSNRIRDPFSALNLTAGEPLAVAPVHDAAARAIAADFSSSRGLGELPHVTPDAIAPAPHSVFDTISVRAASGLAAGDTVLARVAASFHMVPNTGSEVRDLAVTFSATLQNPIAAAAATSAHLFASPSASEPAFVAAAQIHHAPAAEAAVAEGGDPTGQLWFGSEGPQQPDQTSTGSSDNQIGHIDSDGLASGRDVGAVNTNNLPNGSSAGYEAIGLDTAAGLYFAYDADEILHVGHITNDTETNSSSETAQTHMVFGTGANADEVEALAVDPVDHIVFMGLFGQTDQGTGILELQYNPTTGSITNPYDASTGHVTDFNHMLVNDPNTGGTFVNAVAMSYDISSGKLYYIDDTNGWPGSTGSGTTWGQRNGIYVIDTHDGNGNLLSVGANDAPTPTKLTTSQFVDGDNTHYISGFAVDDATGQIYFTVNNNLNPNNAAQESTTIYRMAITGGAATAMTLPGGVSLHYSSYFDEGSNAMTLDSNSQTLYFADNYNSKIISVKLSGDGLSFASGNNSFMVLDSNNIVLDNGNETNGVSNVGDLYFDNLPKLNGGNNTLSGTSTLIQQGGSAVTLLTGAPITITDTDGVHLGFATVKLTNAQAGDVLAATNLAGTSITQSYNSTTHILTLSGNDTYTHYIQVLDSVTYQDSGTDNSSGSHPTRSIFWTVSDGVTIANQTATDPDVATTTVTINRAPTLGADSTSVVEGATASQSAGSGVKANDSDLDGDTLTITGFKNAASTAGTLGSALSGTYGDLTLNLDGSFSYTANNTGAIDGAATGSHPTDTFNYTVSDGHGGSTTQTITFTIDRAPTVVADTPSTNAVESGSALTGSVLTNDSDKDGDSLTVFAVGGVHANTGASVAGTYGHMTINSNGTFSYLADNTVAIDAAATGSHLTDSFNYTADDGHGGQTATTITVTIDRAPTVVSDAAASQAVESGSAVTGNVLTNDSDRDGDSLSVSLVAGVGGNVGNSAATTYGHVNIHADGSYSYVADNTSAIDGAATGSHLTDTFSYTASDGHGGTTSTNLVVTIDRAPTTVGDTDTAVESGAAATGNVLTNDSDRDGDSLSVSAVAGVGGNVGSSTATTYGHVTIHSDGSNSYVADNTAAIDAAATGAHLTDTISYTSDDGHGGTTTANIVITLDRAPTLVTDTPATNAVESGAALTGNVLTNDSDRDGDTLTVSAVAGVGGNVGSSVAGTYGHMTIGSDGTYSYVADKTSAIDGAAAGAHLTDTFSYTADDGDGGTTTTNITVIVDRAPTAVADSANVAEGATAPANAAAGVLFNDSDRDGDSLTVSAVAGSAGNVGSSTAGTYGHLTLNSDGSYSYVADITAAIDGAATGSHPIDSFTVTASDGHGGTTDETLSFTIDRPAVTADDSIGTNENANATAGSGGNANVLDNDSDPDGDTISITAVNGTPADVGTPITLASGAKLTLHSDGTYTYNPNHVFDYLGDASSGARDTIATDTFQYTIDGGATATVTITINGVDSNDLLWGTSAANTIDAGIGNDKVHGEKGADTLIGDTGNDVVLGGASRDHLFGGSGHDTLKGQAGSDVINGGAGADYLYGGGGADTFVYTALSDSTADKSGRDVIRDFDHGTDTIDLSAFGFTFDAADHHLTGVAGQLVVHHTGGHRYLVQADTDGDGHADFAIVVVSNAAPTAGDFIL